jgi:hypothetical protein
VALPRPVDQGDSWSLKAHNINLIQAERRLLR